MNGPSKEDNQVRTFPGSPDKTTQESRRGESRKVPGPSDAGISGGAGHEVPGDLASLEEKAVRERDLERETNAHNRSEMLRATSGWGIQQILRTLFWVLIATILTVAIHYLAPEKYKWLGPDDVQRLKDFLLSGAVVGLVSTYLRNYL